MPYLEELRSSIQLRRMTRRQGWHDDAFVLGDSIYLPTHTVSTTELEPNDEAVELWVQKTQMLDRPELCAHALTVLVALAAPLAPLAGIGGLTTALYSPGGHGKRCIARFALSIWGDPGKLSVQTGEAAPVRLARYGAAGSIPVLHLGATPLSRAEIDSVMGEYSLCAAAVAERRLTWDGLLIAPRTKDFPRETIEASAFDYYLPYAPFPREDFEKFAAQHYGAVGARCAEFLVRNRPELTRLVHDHGNDGIHERNAYLAALLACLRTAAYMGERLGLIGFDPTPALNYATARVIALDKILNLRDTPEADREAVRAARRKTYEETRRARRKK